MKRYSYLFLAALALSSCQNDDNNTIYNDFGGMYKITSMQSENPLDLNNDGIQSFDLYEEIAAPVYSSKNTSDQEAIPFYHFDEWSNYAEVRPAFHDQSDYPLLLLKLPLQEISNEGSDTPFLTFYGHDLSDYEYTRTDNSRVDLKLVTPSAVRLGVVERLERMDKDNFVVSMTARFFDFSTRKWIYTPITVTYKRVTDSSSL